MEPHHTWVGLSRSWVRHSASFGCTWLLPNLLSGLGCMQVGIAAAGLCWRGHISHILLLCNLHTHSFCARPCIPRLTCLGEPSPALAASHIDAQCCYNFTSSPCAAGEDRPHWDHCSYSRHSYHSAAGEHCCRLLSLSKWWCCSA